MTVEELKKVKRLLARTESTAILGENDSVSAGKQWQKESDENRALLYELEDAVCSHDWRQLGRSSLFECSQCNSRRVIPKESL